MRKWKTESAEAENYEIALTEGLFDNYCDQLIEAETDTEAIEIYKQYMLDDGVDADVVENLLYHVTEVEE